MPPVLPDKGRGRTDKCGEGYRSQRDACFDAGRGQGRVPGRRRVGGLFEGGWMGQRNMLVELLCASQGATGAICYACFNAY